MDYLTGSPVVGWTGFFAGEVTSFAALTGLIFVALSINLKQVLQGPGLPGRAGEAIVVLVTPVLIGLVGLIPHQSVPSLGWKILVVAVAAWAFVSLILFKDREVIGQRTPREATVRIALVEAATLLFVVAGALMVFGSAGGLYWQAAGAGVSLVSGISAAWVLLVEILR